MTKHAARIFLACRVVLGALFVWAAATKLPDMAHFFEEVAAYQLLPSPVIPAFAWCVVTVELLAGLLLIIGVAVRAAAGVIALLLIMFIVALSQALLRNLDLSCGCYGGPEPASWWTVIRDVVMLAGSIPFLRRPVQSC